MTRGAKDVLVEIFYCGGCHTDIHFARNGLGFPSYPMVPRHETVGVVRRVGPDVSRFMAGDRVGVGSMAVKFARAVGCQVTVSSHSAPKWADADRVRAHDFLATTDESASESNAGSLFRPWCRIDLVWVSSRTSSRSVLSPLVPTSLCGSTSPSLRAKPH